MTDSKSTTDDTFTAEVNGGARPLFSADKTSLTLSWQPKPGDYWHGHGGQLISLPNQNAYLNVFVPEDTKTGTYELTKDGKDYRAIYAVGNQGHIDNYLSESGQLTLTVVPTTGDERLEGTVSFTGRQENGPLKVYVTKGVFKLIGRAAPAPATAKPE